MKLVSWRVAVHLFPWSGWEMGEECRFGIALEHYEEYGVCTLKPLFGFPVEYLAGVRFFFAERVSV